MFKNHLLIKNSPNITNHLSLHLFLYIFSKCHQEGKTRHRWCVGCGQLRVHDGANRCRPCHLAYKKGVSRGPVDLNNPRYRGKFDAQSPPGASVHVETRSRDR